MNRSPSSLPCRRLPRTRYLLLALVAVTALMVTRHFVTVTPCIRSHPVAATPLSSPGSRDADQNHSLTQGGRVHHQSGNIFVQRIVSAPRFVEPPRSKRTGPSRVRHAMESTRQEQSNNNNTQPRPSSPEAAAPEYVYFHGPKSQHSDLPSERSKRFCPPLPPGFPANASFFPCDWNVKRVICRSRLQANLVCNETSAAILFGQVPVGTPPYRVPFNDTCLARVARGPRCRDDGFRVPRVLHYVTVNKQRFPFFWFLSVLSAVRYLQPCLVLFHGDHLPFGAHWEALLQLVPQVVHVARDQPTSIFGHRIDDIHHRTDVIRLEAVINYGGLYLDADQWVLRSLDDLRLFPVTLGVEFNGSRICNAMFLGEPHAALLNRWYASYHSFNDSIWIRHSGQIPYQLGLTYPDEANLVHTFFRPTFKAMTPVYAGNYDWWSNHGVHLYQRFNTQYYDGKLQEKTTSLGEMTRHILFGSRTKCLGHHPGLSTVDGDDEDVYIRANVSWD